MSTTRKKKAVISAEITKRQVWNPEKMKKVNAFILSESEKQTPERVLKNKLLSIQYQMQDYIEQERVEKEMRILDFVKLYLSQLEISQKELADCFEMKDSNLYKYLTGERKLNPDIVLKLSAFLHTQPEIWYRIQIKNELDALRKEKQKFEEYRKYDYKKLLAG